MNTKAIGLFFIIFFLCKSSFSQQVTLSFGEEVQLDDLLLEAKPTKNPINWINVNTASDTWRLKEESLICTGLPIGVMRSEKQYENFIIHVEWNHINAGGNSGIFVWSDAIPDSIGRLPGGVEVQMLELDWVNQNEKDGIKPPIAYVHGELFGVGGVETIPDNPRGTRSKSIENRAKGKGEWNKYTVICVDGTIKLAVNGKFVNGIRQSTIKKGYLCLESEGSEIHFRNFKLIALEPGVTGSAQIVKNLE
ncbi:DUF1080 domain-containing protein [Sphingobacterium sp. SG20118]|uniref:3-keto-disaccharide hydrolase n=1 Tax=unclassified Sphingobacterium TaxID=2609468 RepID=UPI0009DFF552|nr:DUF1080 domain-containing protein [Sphingobacterium sp. ML3W]